VFFIDKDVPSATAANNVFIVANERGRESVTSARGARLDVVKGERMAVLTDGQRMETQASDGSVKISEFKEYGTQIGNGSNLAAAEEMAARSTYTHELLPRTEPIYRAELGWRIGLPLAALNFVILGLAVASVNPRAGGSGSLMLALGGLGQAEHAGHDGPAARWNTAAGAAGAAGTAQALVATRSLAQALQAGCTGRGKGGAMMRVLRNLLYRDIIAAVGYVTLAFLALFFFFDLVDELRWVGRGGDNGYQITHALLFVVLRIPSHLYELMPITVLIGTIYVMAGLCAGHLRHGRLPGPGGRERRPEHPRHPPGPAVARRHGRLAQGAPGRPLHCHQRAGHSRAWRFCQCAHLRLRRPGPHRRADPCGVGTGQRR
jgi:hypothetical protein